MSDARAEPRLSGAWTQAGPQAGRVDTLVAALAGALWLSWATCVVTFGQRSDGELAARVGRADLSAADGKF